jgi:hypothetical protein
MVKKTNKNSPLNDRLARAVEHFWRTRTSQGDKQGTASGERDRGNRTAATGGKQFEGVNRLMAELLAETGIPSECIHLYGRALITLPGYFRPTKVWDLVVVHKQCLLGVLETKALCGPSFGNNYNNRIEEALGSSQDMWTAYREGLFRSSPEPFIGYVMLLEEHDKSTSPVKVSEKLFPVVDEFRDASYAQRCEHSIRRMVRERCYNGAAFLTASPTTWANGKYREPAADLEFAPFATLMCGQVLANYRAVEARG